MRSVNAEYTIIKFIGIRIVKLDLTGGAKRLIVQPANVVTKGALQGNGNGTSQFIYAPTRIVR